MSTLRDVLTDSGGPMSALTVLSGQVDPFRLDTNANRRDAEWLTEAINRLIGTEQKIHNRGLHYILLDHPKPNGAPYGSHKTDFGWLTKVIGYARWLGYIEFDRIVDKKHAEPVLRLWSQVQPTPYIAVDCEVSVPDAYDLEPYVGIANFTGKQPYHLALIGEKSSLEDVLGAVAERHEADLYLPTGCISNTRIYQLAANAALDGRPMRIFYFADCDPAGHNMAIEVARKMQAFKITHFPDLEFECHRAALTPEQVKQYDLPISPVKDSEKRGRSWKAATGCEQTEIDSLATLQPDLLREIAEAALAPFFDHTLKSRVDRMRAEWMLEAQQVVQRQSGDHLERLRAEAATLLDEKRSEIQAILDTVQIDAQDFDLPAVPELPGAEIDYRRQPMPLCDSAWEFAEQCRVLKADKSYDVFGGEKP